MNLLTFLHKPKRAVSGTICNTELPYHSQIKDNLFPPDQYISEEAQGYSLLKLKDQTTGKSFFLEIKSCTYDWMHQIRWCTEMQLRKYLMCHKKTPTFLLLDVQSDDNQSHTYYLLSMTQACHAYLVDTSIMHWKIAGDKAVTSKQLWSR